MTAATTPTRLMRAMAGLVALAVLAAFATLLAARQIEDAARTVGRDAEPSVALALRMTATLRGMDAAVLSDALTDGGAAIGTSLAFQVGMDALADDIVEASRNVTYGEAEAGPLRGLTRGLAMYQQAVVEARYIGAGNAWITARRVGWASRVNRDFVVPQAEALERANANELEARYAEYRARSPYFAGIALGASAALLVGLVAVQSWLARRTNRVLNPALVLATLLAGGVALWFANVAIDGRADLRTAKSDAYDSLRPLFAAKAAVSGLRADGSMWLLDPTTRGEAQARLDADMRELAGTDIDRPDQVRALVLALDGAAALERAGDMARARAATPQVGGLLGAELGNITFGSRERDAVTQAVAALAAAEAALRDAQAWEAAGDHLVTAWRWLSTAPDGGGAAFAAVQDALDRTIAANQDAFDRHISAALANARAMPFIGCGVLALVAMLSVGGLWLRLREYR